MFTGKQCTYACMHTFWYGFMMLVCNERGKGSAMPVLSLPHGHAPNAEN